MELLVVVSLVAVIAALLAPRLTTLPSRTTPALVSYLDAERSTAIASGRATRVLYTNGRLVSQTTGEAYALGEGERLEIGGEKSGGYFEEDALTTLYPDGSIAAVDLTYVTQEATYAIELSPFTGRVVYRTVSP